MKKIKVALLLAVVLLSGVFVNAQSIDEGKKFVYYEKWRSAKAAFEKLLAANPANADAAYMLAQVYLTSDELKDVAAAKEVLRKGLEANANNALLIAGMGHVELMEGKTQDARNRFETAISLSQGKSIPVLNAVGLANGDFDSKNGDAAYAIEKLKQATTIKGFKDPETYCLLGDAYRKLLDGGSAITAYQNALGINPNYARASYRAGKVYQTQGSSQADVYMKYFEDAMRQDPNYIPVYSNLYNLYYSTNVVKSAEYLEKYLTLMGSDEPQACYYRATIKYAQGLFNEAIAQADVCIASGGANLDPRLYGLKGYAYDKLNDSVNTVASFKKFFELQKPEKVFSTDINIYAKNLLKFPGNETLAGELVDRGAALDSTEAGKVSLYRAMIAAYEPQKKYAEAAAWYKKIVEVKKNPTKTDIFNAGTNFSRGGNYQASIDMWTLYTTKYPTETYGYYMTGVTQAKIDTTLALGLANPSYQKVIDLGEAQWGTDSVKVKAHLLNAYKYFIQYAANFQKDRKAALEYVNKYLVKEPTDAEMLSIQKQLNAAPAPRTAPATRPATGTKPAGGGTQPAASTTKPAATTTTKPAAPKKK